MRSPSRSGTIPAFKSRSTDLGFARADLIEAGQLRNPILSLLFPWGPKQFEATLHAADRGDLAAAETRQGGERLTPTRWPRA